MKREHPACISTQGVTEHSHRHRWEFRQGSAGSLGPLSGLKLPIARNSHVALLHAQRFVSLTFHMGGSSIFSQPMDQRACFPETKMEVADLGGSTALSPSIVLLVKADCRTDPNARGGGYGMPVQGCCVILPVCSLQIGHQQQTKELLYTSGLLNQRVCCAQRSKAERTRKNMDGSKAAISSKTSPQQS